MNMLSYLSVIIPVYNEEENIARLHERVSQVLMKQHFSYEIIYVDDGSQDGSFSQLRMIVHKDAHVKVVRLRRNFGQTAAIAAGVEQSRGEVIVCMDADLQNDPIDIPRLLARLEEGYDVVSGWRKKRQDATLSRKIPSLLANRLISLVTGIHLHDYGCTLKAYRREVFQHIRLYGEMHRFIPAYAAFVGATMSEIEVTHHPRRFGKSKYGLSRIVRVLLDLITVKFLGSYGTRPLYAFGTPGFLASLLSCLLCAVVFGAKILPPHVKIRGNPLLPLAVLLGGFGMQAIMIGLLAELLTRTYHEAQGKAIYVVKDVLFSPEGQEGNAPPLLHIANANEF